MLLRLISRLLLPSTNKFLEELAPTPTMVSLLSLLPSTRNAMLRKPLLLLLTSMLAMKLDLLLLWSTQLKELLTCTFLPTLSLMHQSPLSFVTQARCGMPTTSFRTLKSSSPIDATLRCTTPFSATVK